MTLIFTSSHIGGLSTRGGNKRIPTVIGTLTGSKNSFIFNYRNDDKHITINNENDKQYFSFSISARRAALVPHKKHPVFVLIGLFAIFYCNSKIYNFSQKGYSTGYF